MISDQMSSEQFDALQAAEALLQDPSDAVFIINRSSGQFRKLEAFVDSLPFRFDAPTGFRSWLERSEPKRQEWLEVVEGKHAATRHSHFALTNFPLTDLTPSARATGSIFLVLASRDKEGRVQFSKAMSGFFVFSQLFHEFRHSFGDLVSAESRLAA